MRVLPCQSSKVKYIHRFVESFCECSIASVKKSSTFIDLLNPRGNVLGFGHVSLQKSSTFIDLLNPCANVLGFGHVSLQKSSTFIDL